MTDAQRDYERKRAAKAGMSLDKWLGQKQKQAEAEAPKVAKPARKKGLLSPPDRQGARAAEEEDLIAAHADWSSDPRKRWITVAEGVAGRWSVAAPCPRR